jgi:glycosyltransferase involved in cell wall biosynthesis
MRKRILVRGPVLSRSGYGEQARFAIRSLREYEDRFDIYIAPTNWGMLSWTWEDTDERRWIDRVIEKTMIFETQNGNVPGNEKYDISLQITIPNEWDRSLASYNVGYTAGIETDRASAMWIQKCLEMDKIVVVSNHAKDVFYNSAYGMKDANGNVIELKVDKSEAMHPEIVSVGYPVKDTESVKFDHNFKTKFNFLTIAQWGIRKNLESTIGWFVQEFKDNEDVGLIVKASMQNTSNIDRAASIQRIKNLLKSDSLKDRKCKVYLLHGDMTEEEMNGLYQHRSVKGFINLAHGEGFGLPIFEAAYHKVPVVAMGWSGHTDFLYMPEKKKKGKKEKKEMVACFAKVNHQLGQVQPEALWQGVIEEGANWAYPLEKSYKIALRDVYDKYKSHKKTANDLNKYLRAKFTNANQYRQFADAIYKEEEFDVENWLDSLGEEVFE